MLGTRKWNDRITHRVQTDNAVEAIIRKSGVASWLETCGPTAGTIGAEVTGHNVSVLLPGGGALQGEDALSVWMNDPQNVPLLAPVAPGVDPKAYMDNEIVAYYPIALKRVFGVDARLVLAIAWDDVVAAITAGRAVMIHLTKPRHYLCVVAYDPDGQALVYRDPWPGRTGTDGWNLKMLKTEWDTNVQSSAIIINP